MAIVAVLVHRRLSLSSEYTFRTARLCTASLPESKSPISLRRLQKAEKEGQREATHDKPGARFDGGGVGTRQDPQQKPESDGDNVRDDLLFEQEGVGHIVGEVQQRDDPEGGSDRPREGESHDTEYEPEGGAGYYRDPTGGDGALSLGRMNSILLVIEKIVEDIHGAREETEGDECQAHVDKRFRVGERMTEERGRNHEEVLHPLMGPHQLNEVSRCADLYFLFERWHVRSYATGFTSCPWFKYDSRSVVRQIAEHMMGPCAPVLSVFLPGMEIAGPKDDGIGA